MAKRQLMTLSEIKEVIDREFLELIVGWSTFLDTSEGNDAVNLSVTFRNEVSGMTQLRGVLHDRFSELMEDDNDI